MTECAPVQTRAMMTAMPRGDASVQTTAEIALRAEASRLLGADLTARRLTLPGENHVAVDGVADDPRILCEIFARVGTLKGGQVKKIAEDLLKLVTVRRLLPEWADARIVRAFASEEARGGLASHRSVKRPRRCAPVRGPPHGSRSTLSHRVGSTPCSPGTFVAAWRRLKAEDQQCEVVVRHRLGRQLSARPVPVDARPHRVSDEPVRDRDV